MSQHIETILGNAWNKMWEGIDWNRLPEILTYDPKAPLIFSSGLFLFLFLAFIFGYNLLKKQTTLRLIFVTCFSYYFYYKSSGYYFSLLAVVSLADYMIGKRLFVSTKPSVRKWLVTLSVMLNLGLLCYFKYTNFLYQTFCPLWNGTFEPLDIFLPVGISFFTFQSLSYTIDIYRGTLKPVEHLIDYLFYISFFPQLVAGPIVRAKDFIPQIRQPLLVTQEMMGKGLFLILAGLIKKAIISDYISVNFVERVFDNPSLYTGAENLMGVYGYALQIYCDFSGYSDMAIGIALILGFKFPINFDSPYKSDSITDFWRRWHISLSFWLRDYLYISLGGNRKGKLRQYINLMITMLLGGLWHGASFNFIIWGGMHGAALVVHKLWMRLRHREKDYQNTGIKRLWCTFFTFHFVCLCWIFFRASTVETAFSILQRIFTQFHPEVLPQLLTGYWQVFALMLLGYFAQLLPQSLMSQGEKITARLPLLLQAAAFVVVIYCVIQVKSSDVQPFIYFQF